MSCRSCGFVPVQHTWSTCCLKKESWSSCGRAGEKRVTKRGRRRKSATNHIPVWRQFCVQSKDFHVMCFSQTRTKKVLNLEFRCQPRFTVCYVLVRIWKRGYVAPWGRIEGFVGWEKGFNILTTWGGWSTGVTKSLGLVGQDNQSGKTLTQTEAD